MATSTWNRPVRAVCPVAFTRISYQVGNPWMLDGKMFLPETGTPMWKIACISRPFALAEPVPLTVPIFSAKSLTERGVGVGGVCPLVEAFFIRTPTLGTSKSQSQQIQIQFRIQISNSNSN